MADIDHPKTHVENQNVKEPRVQPESPRHEGIDPLTEGDTMHPREDVKANAGKIGKAEAKAADTDEASDEDKASEQTVKDQQEVEAQANTPDALLPDDNDPNAGATDTAGSDSQAKPAETEKPAAKPTAKPASK